MTCKDCIHYDVCQYGPLFNCEGCFDFINKADVQEVKHGKWLLVDGVIETFYKCSLCGFKHQMQEENYCPRCGARMDGEK